ncbi:MAG: hypothetical protein K2J16_01760, partial [Clostridia bacterium]|nr:hypothetical protein [Clostridia bacterium]
ITKCGENDIVIENAEIYGAERGYVFAVGGLSLKLQAKWKDNLKEGTPEGVVWAAESEGNIATVTENGEITASESGLVEIIADCNGNVAKIIINMQLKLVSMKLRTSNDYYSVGLALETVFASEKYVNAEIALRARETGNQTPDEVLNNEKVPNSTLIQIIGAPKRAEGDTDGVYQAKLLAFYSAFTYEIISGKEYAHFDSETPNRLIFDSAGLEGKGKQVVRVKVRAKYPRYASASTLIEEEVDVKVIYGVEVSNITEMRVASHDQYSYAHLDGNLQDRELVFEHTVTEDHAPEIYRVYNGEYSLRTYGISVVNDMEFEDGEVKDENALKVFGDVYGNGHRLQAELNQLDGNQAMLWIGWSNVTISNFNLRVNKIDKEGTLSVDDAVGFTGEAFQIFSVGGWELWLQGYGPNRPEDYYGHERNRLFNVRYEYSIIENGRRIGQAYNSDYTLDGLIMRNVTTPALFISSRMYMFKEESTGEYITYPDYNHTVLNNCVFTNCLATVGSFAQEGYTVLASGGYGWNKDYHGQDGTEQGDGRFVRKDPIKNAEYFKEHFASKGINAELHQTGFIDIYNWQNVQSAQLISVNSDNESGKLISNILLPISGKLIATNSEFARCRYVDEAKNATYVHMGFLFTGMDFGSGILNEPLHIVATFEDTRFAEPIRSANITETQGADSVVRIAEKFIHSLSVECICYSADSTKNDIMPNSTFDIDENFISRLHKNA